MDDAELIGLIAWAIQIAKGKRRGPRWVAVMEMFACGSTRARELCERFDLDPDEIRPGK